LESDHLLSLTLSKIYDRDKDGFVRTDKTYGYSLKPSTLIDGFERCFPTPSLLPITENSPESPADHEINTGTALPADILHPILLALREDVKDMIEVMKTTEIRIIGGSLLIVYEADIERAEKGLVRLFSEPDEGTDEGDEDEDDGDEGKPKPIPYTVKLIDFGHTRLTPGKGPDTGVIKGLETVLNLLEERISSVQTLLDNEDNDSH
jgi:inositol-polyphosphate multikinase